MSPRFTNARSGLVAALALAALGSTLFSGCGGGGGGGGTGGADPVLLSFGQAGQDNLPLNRKLTFKFSSPIDPSSVGPTSIQIREGGAFGLTVPGVFITDGASITFEPRLPGLCDLTDSGLQPDTEYRVTVVGAPEAFAIRGTSRPLDHTYTFQFHTRVDTDPLLFDDQVPGVAPSVLSTLPVNGSANVPVLQDNPATLSTYEGNEIRVTMSENIHPCSLDLGNTIKIEEYERGDLVLGMPPTDAFPGDPFAWGGTVLTQPQTVRASVRLDQSFHGTELVIRPEFTEFPENALIVVQLTFGLQDLAGQPLQPYVLAFTTQNLPVRTASHELTFDRQQTSVDQTGKVVVLAPANPPIVQDLTSADVDTSRAVGKAQAFLLFSGDGDNGIFTSMPSKPGDPFTFCSTDLQPNDGQADEFDPDTDVVLDTGASMNFCANETDGSTAVIWEFRRFNIKTGRTVRISGVNPAIILVRNEITIASGGRLLARGDGQFGTPQSRGATGTAGGQSAPAGALGGIGVAGGGDGGSSNTAGTGYTYSNDGNSGFGSPSGYQATSGVGAGHGNVDAGQVATSFAGGASGTGGGGGGHGQVGNPGGAAAGGFTTLFGTPDGAGGGTYPSGSPTIVDKLFTPSAGSGGGAAGNFEYYYSGSSFYTFASASGGGGGAGGGFVDLTASGDIKVYGTIDAMGGNGGNGNTAGYYAGSGGGGGGSGGGIRMITPSDIDITGGTLTTAGGTGGGFSGGTGLQSNPGNKGGNGGSGRIVLEDANSLITGQGGATMVPAEGTAGFHRDVFDASRFQGGGIKPELTTDLIFMGPTNPVYITPTTADFPDTPSGPTLGQGPGVGIPNAASRGLGSVGILIEGRGYPILPDGTADLTGQSPTYPPYYTIGYFADSGAADAPQWVQPASPTWSFPSGDIGPRSDFTGNVGDGIWNLDGLPFLQLRITFFLPVGIHPLQPGPFINRWLLKFSYNQ